jgi:ABC-type transport system substrate-binding protein
VVNERIVAERNPRYWDNAHTVINKVTYLPITSEAADVNRYKAGEIDIVYTVPINQFAQLKKPWAISWTFRRSWRPITTNSIPPGRRSTMRACVGAEHGAG